MRLFALMILLVLLPDLFAYHIYVKNDSPVPITKIYWYTSTTFPNILQTPIAPGEQRLVIPGYEPGTHGILIYAGPGMEKDWIDFQFVDLDYIFHFNPPLDTYERKLHRYYEPNGASCATATESAGIVAAACALITALYFLLRNKRE